MKKTIIVFSMVLILVGCSSIPISTMWRMRNFTIQDVASIDPNELRAKVIWPAFLGLKESFFEVTIIDDKGHGETKRFVFDVVEREEKSQGWRRKKTVVVTTLRLSPDVIGDFVQLQKTLPDDKLKPGKASFNVTANFDYLGKDPKDVKSFKLSILLKLAAEEDYFTLIDGAKIELKDNKGDIK